MCRFLDYERNECTYPNKSIEEVPVDGETCLCAEEENYEICPAYDGVEADCEDDGDVEGTGEDDE